jgi:streptogramin lyase
MSIGLASAMAQPVTSSYVFTHLAGPLGGSGNVDGTGAAARFNQPSSVALDSADNVFVADGNQTIRKITPGGVVTTLAGTAGVYGNVDGTGTAAQFNEPMGVGVDSAGNVYVADLGNHTIRKITPGGAVTTLAGTAGVYGMADGIGTAAQFNQPKGVAVDSAGNVYVADARNNTIRKITPGGVVTTLAGLAGYAGDKDGTGTAAQFDGPRGAAADSAGNVFVADTDNCTIRKITPDGVVTTFAGTAGLWGGRDGTGTTAHFRFPMGVAVDSADNVYVADCDNATIRKITPAGVVTTLPGRATYIFEPRGVAVDGAGNVYVADSYGNTISKITPDGAVTTLAGTLFREGSTDGDGAVARFNEPSGVAVDSAGNVYVADTYNHAIRKITPGGVVMTLAGTAGAFGNADGTGTAARFYDPSGIAVDSAGNVYVADSILNTIRKITPGGVVTTLGGTAGVSGSADGIGTVAQFNSPRGIAIDNSGNLYVADTGNHAIRKGQPAGPPVITMQPQGQMVTPGSNVQLSVTVSTVLASTYQWYFNGRALGGATDSVLSVDSVVAVNAGAYTVAVTNALGSVTSNQATLTVSTTIPTPAAEGSGGGAIEGWFALVILAAGATRRWVIRTTSGLSCPPETR